MWAFLSTNFVNPAMLAGAGAVAVPIAIWLFSRLRTRTIEWAAIEFLRRAMKRSQRRLKFENLLLLLIRCLIIIALALAVARPRGQALLSTGEDASSNVVIIIDASYSTGYQIGSTESDTVFDRARRQAREIVSSLGTKDRVIIGVLTDTIQYLQDIPRVMDPTGKVDVLNTLNDPEFVISSQPANGSLMLRSLPPVLDKFGATPPGATPTKKRVFVLYDNQRTLFFENDSLRDPSLTVIAEQVSKRGGELVLIDCGESQHPNYAITSITTRDPIVGVGIPCIFDVRARNASRDDVAGLNVEYFVDNLETPVKRISLDLEANKETTLPPFSYEFREPGPHRFQVRFSSDKLTVDNARSYVVDVREAVKVLLVNGDSYTGDRKWDDELHYLIGAMEPLGPGSDLLRPVEVSPGELTDTDFGGYDIIVVANVATVPDGAISRLEEFAQEGGSVLFTLGESVNESFYNQRLYRAGSGLFPLRLGDRSGRKKGGAATEAAPEWELEVADKTWEPMAMFQDKDMRRWLKFPSIYRIFRTDQVGDERFEGRVLLDFVPRASSSDDIEENPTGYRGPALVEKDYGRGRVLALLTSIDADWNNAPAFDLFYVLSWRQILLHLSQAAAPQRQLGIGDTFEHILDQSEYSQEVRILNPEGQTTIQTPQPLKGNEERFRLSYENTLEPGIYSVDFTAAPSEKVLYFSVNLDPEEGNLTKLNVDELKQALPGLGIELKGSIDLSETLKNSSEGAGANEYWRAALVAAIALLAFESVLAVLLGRRRQ